MFHIPASQIDNVMHPISHLSTAHNTLTDDSPENKSALATVVETSRKMDSKYVQRPDIMSTSSGTTTPTSVRSSLSNMSSVSSLSSSSIPKRSSMKSNMTRRSSSTSVRFAEPEPTRRPPPVPVLPKQHQASLHRKSVPNPLLQAQRRPASSVSMSASSRYSASARPYSTLSPHGPSTPQSGHTNCSKPRANQRYSTPALPTRPNPRLSKVPSRVSENFTSPSLALEKRVSSVLSVKSNISAQSAPAVLQAPPSTGPPGQYNPLEHYIPCLYATCTANYSPVHCDPTYYLSQGPYSLSKHRGYCPTHATKELKEANAECKRNWESLRQNAGRKTLGQIASEFDFFLETFRQERRLEDKELRARQKRLVLGTLSSEEGNKNKQPETSTTHTENEVWNWQYTPRHCTRVSCPSHPYSPFANHLYSFYRPQSQSQSQSIHPLPTLCPPCAQNELDAFHRMLQEKWNSRCGWLDDEWNEWFDKAVKDRLVEREFWERAQEREVREREVSRVHDGNMGVKEGAGDGKGVDVVEGGMKKVDGGKKERKSVFKRLFRVGRVGKEVV
jgi:hypothetical protein